MQYKANSVIYFKGDVEDRIFILKSGRVSLASNDIETGQEVHDYIQTGEFFGVKSAMGRYPREENAIVLSDASVVMFSVPEFEQLVSQNTRIIMKMLKVFSNQLRRLHAKVQNRLEQNEVDPEEGLYRIGEYYMKKRQYPQALYAFQKYLTYYPSGKFNQEANSQAKRAEEYAQKYGAGRGPGMSGGPQQEAAPKQESGDSEERKKQLSDTAKRYYDAVSLFSQQKYSEAMESFKSIAEEAEDQEYVVKSLFEIGRCLYNLGKYQAGIKHFTNMIQRYPKIPELKDALYYIGLCYQQKGEKERAESFYKKILSMEDLDEGLKRKVNKARRSLEEN
jgi:TolA-binding protein